MRIVLIVLGLAMLAACQQPVAYVYTQVSPTQVRVVPIYGDVVR